MIEYGEAAITSTVDECLRQVSWQRSDGLYRVEYARRLLKVARQRAAEVVELRAAYDAQLLLAAKRTEEARKAREAYWASSEGQAALAAAEAEREAAREKAHAADMARRRHRLPVWAEWAAWQVVVNKRTQRAVGEELGGVAGSVIGRGIDDYVYLHHPDVKAENCVGRHWLRLYFADSSEPLFPGRVAWPADALPVAPKNTKELPQYLKMRNAWIYRQRLAGRTLQQISDDVGIVRDRVRQICATQERRDMRRKREWSRPKPWRAPRNLGRPIDIDAVGGGGGARDVWLSYELGGPQ